MSCRPVNAPLTSATRRVGGSAHSFGLHLTSAKTLEDYDYVESVVSVFAQLLETMGTRRWVVRGSMALLIHLGDGFPRRPADIDVDIEASPSDYPLLAPDRSTELFRVLRREPIRFTTPLPGRHVDRVLVEVGERQHPNRRLVLGVTYQRMPVGIAPLRLFHSAELWIPVLPLENCLAQKILRYATPRTSGRVNTKWMDLLDMLLVASEVQELKLGELREALEIESMAWRVAPPVSLPPPPREWLDHWDAAIFELVARSGRLIERGSG